MPLEEYIGKKYVHVKNEANFDKYLERIGVGYYLRKLSKFVSTSVSVQKLEDGYRYSICAGIYGTTNLNLKPGYPLEYKTLDGKKVLSNFLVKEDAILENQIRENGVNVTICNYFTDNELKMNFKVDGIETTMYYKAVN